jgi:hypothetical protein
MIRSMQYGSDRRVTVADVEAMEAELGARLPEGYREFLFRYNGGRPEPCGFRIAANAGTGFNERCSVHSFYGIGTGHVYDDIMIARSLSCNDLPGELLAIGNDPGGQMICIGLRGEVRNRVYWWQWGDVNDRHDHPWEYLSLISDSFDKFIEGLEEE